MILLRVACFCAQHFVDERCPSADHMALRGRGPVVVMRLKRHQLSSLNWPVGLFYPTTLSFGSLQYGLQRQAWISHLATDELPDPRRKTGQLESTGLSIQSEPTYTIRPDVQPLHSDVHPDDESTSTL